MKKLFIIRHAKSDQSFFGNDFERPLNERGKTDAPLMAKRLMEKQAKIDAFISSPAKRAKKTAELFAETFKKSTDEIIFISALYHATSEMFYEVVAALPDNLQSHDALSGKLATTAVMAFILPGNVAASL